MVVFLRIQPGQVPEEPQPEGLDPFRDWQAACSVPNRLICSVSGHSGVQDPKDFLQTPGVEGINAFSQGLGDGPCALLECHHASLVEDLHHACYDSVLLCVQVGSGSRWLLSTLSTATCLS